MKVGTDGVLLGAWAETEGTHNILDIGTGSGLIALMLAQRTGNKTAIDAIEIEPLAFEQAQKNIMRSPWPDKVKAYHTSLQNFHSITKYDLIISNPPYFQNSQKPPDARRVQARHTTSLTYLELLTSVKKLLAETGSFNVILPYAEGLQFIELARQFNLFCTRRCSFRTRKEKPIERWLLEFSFNDLPQSESEIILYRTGEEWSEEYKLWTKDFYLKL